MSPWPLLLPALEDPHVNAIAGRIKKKPSQVLFRWALQMGAGFIMRSTERMRYMDAVEVGEKILKKFFGYLAICEETICSAAIKKTIWSPKFNQNADKI